MWRIIEMFTDQAASETAGEGSYLHGFDPHWYLARRVPALVSSLNAMRLLSTSSKSRRLELKAANFCPWKPIAIQGLFQAHPKSCAVGKFKNPVANLKLNAYLCRERTCEAAFCSGEHRALVCAGESERQRYQQQGQEKTGMSQQSLSTDFSGVWIRSLANTSKVSSGKFGYLILFSIIFLFF